MKAEFRSLKIGSYFGIPHQRGTYLKLADEPSDNGNTRVVSGREWSMHNTDRINLLPDTPVYPFDNP